MSWDEFVTKQELTTSSIYTGRILRSQSREDKNILFSPPAFDANKCVAAMLVKNEKLFANLYHDELHRSKANSGFAKPYSSCLIFPQTIDGINNMRSYFESDPREAVDAYVDALVDVMGGQYELNDGEYRRQFQLRSLDGKTLIHVGIFIDAKEIQWMESKFDEMREKMINTVVACYEWQVPYYKAILPDMGTITIYDK